VGVVHHQLVAVRRHQGARSTTCASARPSTTPSTATASRSSATHPPVTSTRGLLGYKEDAPIYDYNPDKAKALLQEAGATSLSITLPVTGSTAAIGVRIAQFLQQDLEDVGVTVKIEQVRQTAYDLGAELPKKYSIWNMAWGMGLPDPSELVSSLSAPVPRRTTASTATRRSTRRRAGDR
jgi:ABC-type transport system substrate-binding protein